MKIAEEAKGYSRKYNQPTVAQRYHTIRYGDLYGRLNLWAMRRSLAHALVHIPARGRVLDVPCGTGQYCWQLAAAGFRTVAADVAPEMVKVAAALGNSGETAPDFTVEDIFHLSFATNSFDGAICIRLFNLLNRAERVAVLSELSRVANTIIATYNHPYTVKHFCRLFRYRLGFRREPKSRLSRRQIEEEAAEAGLKVRELISVAPLFSEVWLVILTKQGIQHP